MDIEPMVWGQFPRTEALVAATRSLERARTTIEEVEAREGEQQEEIVTLQRECGYRLVHDGAITQQHQNHYWAR